MGKRIRIRLYRAQDYDLITLYYDKNFGFKRKMEAALLAFANGQPLPSFSVEGVEWLPKPVIKEDGEKTKTGTKFVIATSISIPDSEKKASDLLESLASGDLVNSFLKLLLRRCLVDVESLYIAEDMRGKYKDPQRVMTTSSVSEIERKQSPNAASVPKLDERPIHLEVLHLPPIEEPAPTEAPISSGAYKPDSVSASSLFDMADQYSY